MYDALSYSCMRPYATSEAGRRAVVRVLIEHGALIDAPRHRYSVFLLYWYKVQILTPEELRHSDGATALHLAAYTGHGDVCALLVSLVIVAPGLVQ